MVKWLKEKKKKKKFSSSNINLIKNTNTIAFGCMHIPFEKEGYIDFINETKKKYNCNNVVCLGDETDNNSINYHDKDPDGMSGDQEFGLAKSRLSEWYKAFNRMSICIGNHSALPFRKAKTFGISKHFLKDYRDLWEAPDGWWWNDCFEFDGVIYEHGIGSSGDNAHKKRALHNMQSTVIAHLHSNHDVGYMASNDRLIFGAASGCGIDRRTYAMAYGKHFPRKPILGCVVVLDNGREAHPIPMKLGGK